MALDHLPRAVIFDLDGLIFDTETLYQKSLPMLATERSLHSITQDVLDKTVGLSWEGTRDLLDRLLAGSVDIDELIDAWSRRYEALSADQLELKRGVRDVLAALVDREIPRSIATGSSHSIWT